MPKKKSAPMLRGKIWVDIGRETALTENGADLLEQIDICGSLSEAARRLGFAYRRAWLLLDKMNRAWDEPLVLTAIGGTRGGGAKLTPLGKHVLGVYRDLQLHLEHFLSRHDDPFAPRPKS